MEFACPVEGCKVFPYEAQADVDQHVEKGDHYFGPKPRTPLTSFGDAPKREAQDEPITDPQRGFIKRLIAERDGKPGVDTIRAELNAAHANGTLTKQLASNAIDRLQAISTGTIFTLEG